MDMGHVDALTQRAMNLVQNPAFRTLPGTLFINIPRHNGDTGYTFRVESSNELPSSNEMKNVAVALNDAATIGNLISIIRQRFNDEGIHVKCSRPIAPRMEGNSNNWIVVDGRGRILLGGGHAKTEAEAILNCFENM